MSAESTSGTRRVTLRPSALTVRLLTHTVFVPEYLFFSILTVFPFAITKGFPAMSPLCKSETEIFSVKCIRQSRLSIRSSKCACECRRSKVISGKILRIISVTVSHVNRWFSGAISSQACASNVCRCASRRETSAVTRAIFCFIHKARSSAADRVNKNETRMNFKECVKTCPIQ